MGVKKINSVIISRTDAIGDVVLTLPLASLIKKIYDHDVKIIFLGKTYTQPIIKCCGSVDGFINYDDFKNLKDKGKIKFLNDSGADAIIHVFPRKNIAFAAKKAGIKNRIGTTNRLFHWFSCNSLVRLSRKNSKMHEAVLNARLLKPLGHSGKITIDEIPELYNFKNRYKLPENISGLLSSDKFRLILHPKSNASAREWKLDYYRELFNSLPEKKFQIIITAGKQEEAMINEWCRNLPPHVINLAGKLSLEELIALTDASDGLLAASTGPLHIASALGKYALGIYPPIVPMDPVRWSPVGKNAGFLVSQKNCSDCKIAPASCHCINDISPAMVQERIIQWSK